MSSKLKLFPLFILMAVLPGLSFPFQESRPGLEEEQDYYRKWLEEDVVYIITEEEQEVFEKLTTPEEKERFIERFWTRRDTDPATAANEYKEEHYRRIAFANERFHAGIPGWRTDRGKIYIIHGPPDEREVHLAGETYRRPMNEGGGSTKTYPFESWRYRHIPGIGSNVVLEFVDSTLDGNFVLALNPEEKDALIYAPTLGMTLAEEMGMASRRDRPTFSPNNRFNYPLMNERAADSPFQRYELYSKVQRPTQLKYRDLEKYVDVRVTYEPIALQLRPDYFRLNQDQLLVPLTFRVANKDLTLKPEGECSVGRVAIYASITNLSNELVHVFEDELLVSLSHRKPIPEHSVYQKILTLPIGGRFKLELVVKDLQGEKVGTAVTALVPPAFDKEGLKVSPLILSQRISPLDEIPLGNEMFVLGNVRLRPSLDNRFSWIRPLGVYLQLYDPSVDQSSQVPSLRTSYQIIQDGRVLKESVDEDGSTIQFASGRRIVLIKSLDIDDLSVGSYRFQVQVEDRISGEVVSSQQDFQVVDPPPARPVGSG